MKKILLIISLLVISLLSFAADLNPFAYGLSSTFDAAQKKLTVNYKLNATATNVKVVVYDNASYEYTVDCSTLGLSKGAYVKEITLPVDCPSGVSLSWRVEVTGSELNKPTKVTKEHYLYHPRSIDIDNNPENDNFGIVFVVEGLHDITGKNSEDAGSNSGLKKFGTYLSWGIGAGLYAFDASFDNLKIYGANGYGGGQSYTVKWQFPDWNGKNGTANAYSPNRVRVSKDGRIFISSCTPNSSVLWEVTDKDMFNSGTPKVWESVVSGTFDNTNYCLNDAQGNYIAGPNMSLDVKGSGDDLTLLMLSGNILSIENQTVESFRLMEYNLGKNTKWNTAPKVDLIAGHKSVNDKKIIAYNVVQVCYDNEGGFWVCQDRAESKGYASLFHVNANNEVDLNETILNRGGGGIRFNSDFTKVIISGKHSSQTISGISSTVTSGTLAWATVYSVSKQNAKPVLTKLYEIDMTCLGNRLPDFAWDYADNIYASSYSKETVTAWAMPRTDVTAVTPAASKYSFEKETQYGDPQLAPFAYDLRRTKEGDGRVKLHFMLNAHARRVKVILEDKQASKEYVLRDYPTSGSDKNYVPYHSQGYGTVITTEDIERLGLSYNKNYSWRVDVYGENVESPAYIRSYSFYHPSAVDIDNNPNNETFGLILANEAMQEIYQKSGFESYHSYDLGAGIYAFSPDFKPIMNGDKKGFNGGKEFSTTTNNYAPRRIRFSKDGRIFATAQDNSGEYLWEIDPTNLDNWTSVFKGTNNNYVLKDGSGNFIAGTNAGFDVRGVGGNLQLLMLSADKPGSQVANSFKLHEYNLGTDIEWSTEPTRELKNCHLHSSMITSQSQVQYDNEGGYWITYWVNNNIYGGIAHFKKNGEKDFSKDKINMRNAGLRFNDDFSKVIIATNDLTGQSKVYQQATIYAVSKNANGEPVLIKELVIDMSLLGNNLNDFAWDYAGNLYACSNSLEKVAAYVMPRSANDKVSTPARDEFVVNLTQPVPRIVAYNLTYRPNGANQTYDFSFYANTQPTGGSISFYKNGETTPLYVHQISNLIQGDNTVSIPMDTLDAYLNLEKDITWELTLSAPESQVFGKIYKSGELNTAYATINTNPATDYFGHVYAGNQQNHVSNGSGGNIYVWAPGSGTNNNQGDRYHTIKTAYTPTLSPNDKNGFTQVSAPGIAPDGKVYFTDNGKTGGVYVMDPKDYSITSFFEDEELTQNEIAQYLYKDTPVGTPSSSAHIYWPGGNTAKLFLVSTEYYTKTNIGSQGLTLHRHNAGYYIYPLTEQDGQWKHTGNWEETEKVDVKEENLYQVDFTIVGTSHGAWYCQHRRNDNDVFEARSLMFFDNNGVRQYCSTDNDMIYGSCGAGLAVNKEETLLAMASGLGGIMFFDIVEWDGDKPTLTYKYTSALNNNLVVTSLNFDYAGNLVATVGDTNNDATDKHRMVVFTMPKEGENTVTVPARFSQRVAALYADERMDVHFDENITNASPYQTVDVFRRLQAGMCNTICLPFSIENKVGTPYEKARIFSFTGVSQGNDQVELQFSEVDAMQAGVPYLIQPENDITDLLRFSPVQVNASFNNEGSFVTYDGITYYGTINPKRLEVDKNYLFLVANNRLATASAGGDMLGLRGYFTVNGEPPAKAVISFREGVSTGTNSTVTLTTDDVQKVLQNQQILIIRDGKIYNILGETIATK